MAETYVKKEFRNKKLQKRREKERRREERKLNNDKGKPFKEMFMYVDEFGRLVETPPSEEDQIEIELSEIQLGAAPLDVREIKKTGTISFLNDEKGYGFISAKGGGENLFFHLSNCGHEVKKGNMVSYEVTKSARGFAAVDIQLVK